MSDLPAATLAEIEAAADAQYDQRPGEPLSPSRATQIRPLLPESRPERQAA